METPKANEAGKSSPETVIVPKTQDKETQGGSVRSLLRKASDLLQDAQRLYDRFDSYPKNRRYVHLRVNEIHSSLVTLYQRMFAHQWSYFKRESDGISTGIMTAAETQRRMARIYVSHWMVDLYNSVRVCVDRISAVALNEVYDEELAPYSNEYDAFLVALNAAIRPTHLVGCHENVMFVPRFPDNSDFTSATNPFNIEDFTLDETCFNAILNAIKDKRAGWKMAYLSTDTVGRPTWLFDWFGDDLACAWFPLEGNYNTTDVAIAYILGVACTPKLAHFDADSWQLLPDGMNARNVDITRIRRVDAREVFADYEVDHYSLREGRFTLYLKDSDYQGTPAFNRKRARGGREEDKTMPSYKSQASQSAVSLDDMEEEITNTYICLKTYLYYKRVVLGNDERERKNVLTMFILDPMRQNVK